MLPGPVAVIDGDLHPLASFELTKSEEPLLPSLGHRRNVADPEWIGTLSSYRSFDTKGICMHERINIILFKSSYKRIVINNSTICITDRTFGRETIEFAAKGPIQKS